MAEPNARPATLKVNGNKVDSLATMQRIEGWESTYVEISANRSDSEQHALELPENGFVEFELAGGEVILVATDNIGAYLGAASRGATGDTYRLGEALQPAGQTSDTSRGIGAWIVKAIRVARPHVAAPAARALAQVLETKALGIPVGFYKVGDTPAQLTPTESASPSDEPLLVLIHGTISSTDGSFGKLWAGPHRSLIQDRFGDRIYALQHNTLTESPVANALAIARALPPNARLHLLTHSRGGLVGELLARGSRENGSAFTDEEIRWMTDSASAMKRDGYDGIAKQLRELSAVLDAKKFRIERFVRVACPARGTTLLAGRLDRWASTALNLISRTVNLSGPVGTAVTVVVHAFRAFAAAVVAERSNAATLPGLEAMTPDSPLIALLNNDESRIQGSLHVVAGDYQGNSILKYLADAFAERYYGGDTDLVVNTASMHGGAQRVEGIYRQFFGGSEGYYHLNYFEKQHSSRAIALALIDSRNDVPGFERLASPSREAIARGGKAAMPKDDAPILFILPGIMGSALQRDGDTIWFDFFQIVKGDIRKLGIQEKGVGPAGWLDRSYEDLAKALSDTYEIWPFAYDWRLSIKTEAKRFGDELDRAIDIARGRKKPVHIVAHSMGGLVARLALHTRWTDFKSLAGARFVQLGTPNGGSAAIGTVLLARDRFANLLADLDFKHTPKGFLEIVSKYPGVLELMARQHATVTPTDFYDPAQWEKWSKSDEAANLAAKKLASGQGGTTIGTRTYEWAIPDSQALSDAKSVVEEIAKSTLDKDVTVYVAGCAKETPVDIVLDGDTIKVKTVPGGDGRVPWQTGIPQDVPVYYADAVHGDLPSEKQYFAAYRQILATGATTLLPSTPPKRRGAEEAVTIQSSAEARLALFPTHEEVLAAAIGGTMHPPGGSNTAELAPVEVVIVHGSLATAEDPVIIGAYAYDTLRGTAKFVDQHLAGRLERARAQGTYPNFPGEAQVFLQRSADARPKGAIVVGLGTVGTTTPGDLSRAYQAGLLSYDSALANQPDRDANDQSAHLDVATLVIGTGFGGLSVELSLRALLDAIVVVAQKTARDPARADAPRSADTQSAPLRRITIYERADNRAIAAALWLARLIREPKYAGKVYGAATVRTGKGGYRALVLDDAQSNGTRRVHITRDERTDTVQFTLITDRARNPVVVEPSLLRDIDGLLKRSMRDVSDKPGLARAMFELLVPNEFKEGLADAGALILGVDYHTASYPWELLRDAPVTMAPLCTRLPVVRQLATERGRQRVALARVSTAFIVGDTDSGMAALPGAQKEALSVAALLRDAGWSADPLIRPSPDTVYERLFDTEYRILHLACHGIAEAPAPADVDDCCKKHTPKVGAVLSKDVMLSAAHVNKLRRVPEFVFLNCCHLGDTSLEDANQWGRMAANLAVQFIEMGAKAVVAAGWEVQDSAGTLFATQLYDALLHGHSFGDALRMARDATWRQYPNTNTWGAYQAYGDESYRMTRALQPEKPGAEEAAQYPAEEHRVVLLARIDALRADAEVEQDTVRKGEIRRRLADLSRRTRGSLANDARVQASFGYAYSALREWEHAIAHFAAALKAEDAEMDLRAVERLADAETRLGAVRAVEQRDMSVGEKDRETDRFAMMDAAAKRLNSLISIQPSVERHSLLAANHKQRAQIARAEDDPALADSLMKMVEHYNHATMRGRRTGRVPYYPATNWLFGQYLRRELSHLSEDEAKEVETNVDTLIEEIIADARLTMADEDSFFHFVAEADARLAQWLWKWQGSASAEKLTSSERTEVAEKSDRLSTLYAVAVQRFGSAREMDSTYRQFKFISDMLPEGSKASGFLAQLRNEIDLKTKKRGQG
jgi:pimeloyl-ACP methyl ester carboxylesterase